MFAMMLVALALFSAACTGGRIVRTVPEPSGLTDISQLWQEPANLESRDLTLGPAAGAPRPSTTFTFVKVDRTGHSPGYDVRDQNGIEWSVKLGPGSADRSGRPAESVGHRLPPAGQTDAPALTRVGGARMAQGNRNNLEDFEQQGFIKSINGNRIEFDYKGIYQAVVETVTPADVVWACRLLSRLSDAQWTAAFTAGGYPPDQTARFVAKLKSKIAEGLALANRSTE